MVHKQWLHYAGHGLARGKAMHRVGMGPPRRAGLGTMSMDIVATTLLKEMAVLIMIGLIDSNRKISDCLVYDIVHQSAAALFLK